MTRQQYIQAILKEKTRDEGFSSTHTPSPYYESFLNTLSDESLKGRYTELYGVKNKK